MSRDPVDDLVEEMKRMEQRSLGRSLPSVKKNCEMVEEDDSYFPILSLPDELIGEVFSFLSIEDRFKARVNKKLNEIELKSKYFVKSLKIGELSGAEMVDYVTNKKQYPYGKYRNEQEIIFDKEREYSSDSIRRISQNASIGQLSVKFDIQLNSINSKFHREIYDLTKNFDVDHLILDFQRHFVTEDVVNIINSSFFAEVTKKCKSLKLPFLSHSVTLTDLHELYEAMVAGSSKFRSLEMGIFASDFFEFLSLIGVTYRERKFFSNKDIQVFEDPAFPEELLEHLMYGLDLSDGYRHTYIFDGNVELWINYALMQESLGGEIKLRFHESQESLDNAKYGRNLVKMLW
ncbi:hypothetical protein PMAYCL1PPCAC_13556 [Pristionchus mayeri]|uniref:F-box domain-containing protein n=1 Tax=Pristionchus mayeri TaxID=1317129 RepID=A0AAN4ZQS5_9BILA|nr:hypothetical protein PMAYCL1PPCAC_13556 [Pristionchus mayeri]